MAGGARKIAATSIFAAVLAAAAMPVQGYFQVHGFFNASEKYRAWFHETRWLQDTPAQKTRQGFRVMSGAPSTAVKYPYPDKAFVMTEARWRASVGAALYGRPDWYDVEVVRQRAEVEEFPPAMDLLAWMYQEGRGLRRDLRRAYNMYERAKLAGHEKIRGDTAEIFESLTAPEKVVAQIEFLEDIRRMKPQAKPVLKGLDRVKLHVMKQQRDLNVLRLRHKRAKKRSQGLLGAAY